MSDLVAVFVDGDNVPSSFAGRILRIARSLGRLSVAKVYGNKQAIECWRDAFSFQLVYSGDGKNATDVLIAVEATDLVLTNPVQSVVMCSSDADFSHLVRYIRSKGINVVGMGEDKTKAQMRHACSEFQILGNEPSETPKSSHPSDLDPNVIAMIRKHQVESNSSTMPISTLGSKMYQVHKVKISDTSHRTWRAYLECRPDVYRLNQIGSKMTVSLRQSPN